MTGKEIYDIYLKKPVLHSFLLNLCAVAVDNYDTPMKGMKMFKKHIIATLDANHQREATRSIFKLRIGNKTTFFDFRDNSLFLQNGAILIGSALNAAQQMYNDQQDMNYEGTDDEVRIFGIVPSQNKIVQCCFDGDNIHDVSIFTVSDEVLESIATIVENNQFYTDRETYNLIFKQYEPDVINCIHCDEVVHPLRVAILKDKKQEITCITCAEHTVGRVMGFQANHDKACREIEVVTADQGRRLMKLQRKTGGATGGPGFGPKAGKVVYNG